MLQIDTSHEVHSSKVAVSIPIDDGGPQDTKIMQFRAFIFTMGFYGDDIHSINGFSLELIIKFPRINSN